MQQDKFLSPQKPEELGLCGACSTIVVEHTVCDELARDFVAFLIFLYSVNE